MNVLSLKAMLGRTSTVLASAGLHVSLLVSLVGGHPGDRTPPRVGEVIELAELEGPPPPIAPPEPERRPAPQRHQHPYPVPASHDQRPHDPALVHTPLLAANVVAAPVLTQEARPAPLFTIASGHLPETPTPRMATGDERGEVQSSEPGEAEVPESGVSRAARLLSSPAAAYPVKARAEQVEADVTVEIVVDRSGLVRDARAIGAAGYGFDEAALTAVRRYRFSPAERAGLKVRVRMRWVVQFRLN